MRVRECQFACMKHQAISLGDDLRRSVEIVTDDRMPENTRMNS